MLVIKENEDIGLSPACTHNTCAARLTPAPTCTHTDINTVKYGPFQIYLTSVVRQVTISL